MALSACWKSAPSMGMERTATATTGLVSQEVQAESTSRGNRRFRHLAFEHQHGFR